MMRLIKYTALLSLALLVSVSCKERYVTYSDAEYVMFADQDDVWLPEKS